MIYYYYYCYYYYLEVNMYCRKSIWHFQGVASKTPMKSVTENTGTGRKEKQILIAIQILLQKKHAWILVQITKFLWIDNYINNNKLGLKNIYYALLFW